ncbi:hypothetical protein Tco_0102983 [Tanacetum coccineum]
MSRTRMTSIERYLSLYIVSARESVRVGEGRVGTSRGGSLGAGRRGGKEEVILGDNFSVRRRGVVDMMKVMLGGELRLLRLDNLHVFTPTALEAILDGPTDESICYRCTLDVQRMSRYMVPYEAFACRCGAGDVVLRESYKPKTRGKLYYACPRSKEKRVRLLIGSPGASTTPIYSPGSSSTPIYSPGSSTPPRYSPGASTPQSYSPGTSRNAECSNCKHLLDKITVLEATVDMYMHPEQHTVNSAALFHEVYNNMGKLDLE